MFLVEDVMTREVVTLKPDDDLSLAKSIFALGRVRHLPVVQDNGILMGLVTHRDLLRAFAERSANGKVRAADVMQRDVVTTTPKANLRKALNTMTHNKYGCLPVVDPSRVLVGIVTEYDLVKFAAHFARDFDDLEKRAAE